LRGHPLCHQPVQKTGTERQRIVASYICTITKGIVLFTIIFFVFYLFHPFRALYYVADLNLQLQVKFFSGRIAFADLCVVQWQPVGETS